MLGRRASQIRTAAVQAAVSGRCPWVGTVIPPRTIEALVDNLDSDEQGLFASSDVNASIELFNGLDNMEHITGGKANFKVKPQMERCNADQNGKVSKEEIQRVFEEFANGPLQTTVHHVVHIFQELTEIEFLFLMWAGSKTAIMTHEETVPGIKNFNRWATKRHDPREDGMMMIAYFDSSFYGGTATAIDFSRFARWIWEELSVLEEKFSEPFEITLGKLSECVESAKRGATKPETVEVEAWRVKERCPWSGTLLPPRTIGAYLANYKESGGRYSGREVNTAIQLFNDLDNLDHLLGGNAKFSNGAQPKMNSCTADEDGKVTKEDIQNVFKEFADRVLDGNVSQVIHAFQELQEIEWLFMTWAGDKNRTLPWNEVSAMVKNFNKWSMKRHEVDPRGLMAMNNYDMNMYGADVTYSSFSRWVFEELCTLEEIFGEPFESLLQVLSECMQASKVMTCFKAWDTVGSNNIGYEALLGVVNELVGDEANPAEIRALLDKAGNWQDGVVDYRRFVEAIMLHHLQA